MRARTIIVLFTVMVGSTLDLFGQDKFPPVRLTFDPAQEGFPTWSPDGKYIVFSRLVRNDTLGTTGLYKISPGDTGVNQIFSGLAEHPRWSPDGRFIVFDSDSGRGIKMIAAEGGVPKKFIPDSISIDKGGLPCWSPTGSHIAFKEGVTSSLCVCDVKANTVARIFHQEGTVPLPGCWSKDGRSILVALMDRQTRASTIWNVSVDGTKKEQLTGHREGFYRYLALSPDGSLLVYAAMEGRDLGLWIMPAQGGASLPLAVTHPGHNESPAWSPDGKRLAFTSTRSGGFDVWMMDIDVEALRGELESMNK